ncbi:hypothetical protein SAMN05216548_108109 [Faunimonas pinastri]|uniref:SDR family oxidoreductase n=1 Tax=Faunimonas pinastri TaxID=1855383 RepID=A0A1H9JG53_9HYPH|nr:SDR family oxidoreductase [Faunimonas pinastri]SEQ85737.1 hypothetical protein SAMN05216548_108109 [Faunimonas pinastri]
MPLNERPIALITGASSGIGKSYAEQIAAKGHDLVVVARREDRLRVLAAEIRSAHGVDVEVLPVDLGTPEGVQAVCDRLARDPAVDMLVNNAGYAARGKVAELDLEALDAMLRVNVLALSRLSNAALQHMSRRGRGAIINIGSGTMFAQFSGNAGYGSSKIYVAAFTRHMQLESQGSGVQVQLLIPGVIATDFHEIAGNDLANFPPERVMMAPDLVRASLRALEMNELVCIPSLPDIRDWEAYEAAEQKIWANVSRDRIASRYES